jgi:tetratricopeptide (TPR) repeat protein
MSGRRRAATVIAVAVAVTSCSTPFTSQSKTSPRPTPTGSVKDALMAMFDNRYTDAESIFKSAISRDPRSADAHAYYALFLNYNHRFTEAQSQVQNAVSIDGKSAIAAAVDTRVHDWSAGTDHQKLVQAADVGANAVKVGPKSALAHAFYSEALADSGNTDKAKSELDVATSLAQDSYEKAEVEREKANLAGDTGDKAGAITHFKAASTIQSHWAERTRELAGVYFSSGQSDQGVAVLKQAITSAPSDPTLRLYLGTVALEQQDVPVAQDALAAANRLKPNDPQIESSLAMADFTLHHDVGEAERLLRQAAADAPTNARLADLLYGFLKFIKRDDAGASGVTYNLLPSLGLPTEPGPPVSVDINRTLAQQAALKSLNDYRAKAGLQPVHLDSHINLGAESHSYWWLFNLSLPDTKALGIHHEVAGTPGYTGVTMHDRAVHFGFPSNVGMAEVIDHEGTPQAAVTVWIDSVYHRFPLMSPLLDAIGFGESLGASLPMETMDVSFKNSAGDPASMVPYPAEGQQDVPLAFTGNELPDPVPGGYKSPTGYPITVNFNPYLQQVSVGTTSLRDGTGHAVPFWFLPPLRSDENVLTILPKTPLDPKTTYQVHVEASILGVPLTRDWSFTTESAPAS